MKHDKKGREEGNDEGKNKEGKQTFPTAPSPTTTHLIVCILYSNYRDIGEYVVLNTWNVQKKSAMVR